jgi:peptidoglycan/LPS O-acetylase OafA/YrhL
MRSEPAGACTPPKQIPSLTPLRGIAALFVVAFHLQFFVPNLRYEAIFPAFLFGYLWVDFFFVLSGFIIAHVYGRQLEGGIRSFGYRRYLYARWCRIYPLHFVVLASFVAFELVQIGLHHGFGLLPGFRPFSDTHTIPGIFSHLLLINSLNLHDRLLWNFPAWSISAEVVAYLCFPVLFLALSRRPALLSWLTFSVLLYLLNLLALTNGGRLAIHHDYGAVRCLLEFSMGILVYEAHRSGRFGKLLGSDAAFLVVFGSILVGMTFYLRDVLLIPAFAALVLTGARNDGAVARLLGTRALTHLGDVSYSIYMVNILLFQVIQVGWKLVAGEPFGRGLGIGEAWIAWCAAMALVILASSLGYRFVERPARAWLRGVGPYRPRPEAEKAAGSVSSTGSSSLSWQAPS